MKENQKDPSHQQDWTRPHERREHFKRRDAREHRERILVVARELFETHGVDTVSMHQIAIEAGIGQGTLYRCYAHKGDLCMDLLDTHYRQFVAETKSFLEDKQTAPALERLHGLLERLITFLENECDLLNPIVRANPRNGQNNQHHCPGKEWHDEPFHWLHERYTELLTDAVAHGELSPLDVTYTADALTATLFPLMYRFQRRERGFTPERIMQGISHIYIEGLKASSKQAEPMNP